MPAKLSISDAIGLITLRLGRVEAVVSKIPSQQQPDDVVFKAIVARLDAIEERLKSIEVTPPNDMAEVASIKAMVITLQTFTMETYKRLLESKTT